MAFDNSSPQEHVKAALESLQTAHAALAADTAANGLTARLSKAISFLELLIPELPSVQAGDTAADSISMVEYSAQVIPVTELLKPISSEKPAGSRDMTVLRSLQALIMDRSGKADFVPQYREAVKVASDIIKTRCKDLAAAMLLIESAFETYGFAAIADGLMLVNGFISGFWDDFYPQAPDGDCEKRSNELDGFNKLIPRFLSKCGNPENYMPSSGSDRSSVEKEKAVFDCISQQYDILYKSMYERFEGASPDLRDFVKAIEPYKLKITRTFNQFIDKDNAAKAASTAMLDRTLQAEIDKAKYEEEEKLRLQAMKEEIEAMPKITREPLSTQDACERIDSCASFLISAAPHDPLGYLINRARRWYSGLHKDGFKAFPSPEDRQRVGQFMAEKRWKDVLTASEKIFVDGGDKWLDLQRYAVQAAANLGKQYEIVKKVLLSRVVEYADWNESALTLQLADMTPAAGQETKEWLEKEKGILKAASGETVSGGACSFDTELKPIMERGLKGDVSGAVDEIVRRVYTSRSSRDRFMWQLGMIELFINCNQAKMALPVIEELTDTISRKKIDEWEDREFLVRFYKAGYDGLISAFGAQKAPPEKVDFYFNRLCIYNPNMFIKKK